MISVIIPLYNKEEYISDTLRSVLGQSFKDFEIVVVNDGSTDGSKKIVEDIDDSRIRLINIVNSGVSEARNTGIDAARYPWVSFLDADDWWAPDFLMEMKSAMEKYPGYKLFASGRTLIFPYGARRYEHSFLPEDGTTGVRNYFKVISKYLPLINSSNCLISKELLLNKGQFRPGQRKHEDHDLWMRLALNEEVVFVNQPLSFYRKTVADSMSATIYEADDFMTYLKTLGTVKSQLSGVEAADFDRYLGNFLLLTYLKNYWKYNRSERREVLKRLRGMLKGWRMFIVWLTFLLPFNLYPVLKPLKR